MTAWSSLLICGYIVSLYQLVPALQLSVVWRSGVRSKGCLGPGAVLWELLEQPSSQQSFSHGPALFKQGTREVILEEQR